MKKTKKALFSILLACMMTFYTDSVSLAGVEPITLLAAGTVSEEIGTPTEADAAKLQDKIKVIGNQTEQNVEACYAKQEAARIQAEQEAAEKEAAAKAAAEKEAAAKEAAAKAAAEKEAAQQAFQRETTSVNVSSSDEELLAALIYCEAGGEPYEGQVAVGAVVMNRVRSSSFPNTIREVIYQSGQFGPAITGKLERVLAGGQTTDSCRQAAREAIAGYSPVGSALYFGDGQNFGQKIGGHWFHS